MKTIAFEFDLGTDTAASVAGEMVDEMQLSAGDTASIAAAIRAEVHMLTGTSTPHLDGMMHHAAQPHTPKGLSGASEGTAAASPLQASSADLHDISSPMSVAELSGGQPAAGEEDLAQHGSSADENWAECAEPALATESDSSVGGRSPDHRASLSRLLSPRKRSSTSLPHMKRLLSQVRHMCLRARSQPPHLPQMLRPRLTQMLSLAPPASCCMVLHGCNLPHRARILVPPPMHPTTCAVQEFGPLEEQAAAAEHRPLAPPSAVCAPMRMVPRTGSPPHMLAAAAAGLPPRLTPAASAGLCHPSGASDPPPAARPARVDLPPHRTHAVAREQLPSAFSGAATSPLPITASHASLLSLARPSSPGTEPGGACLERAASDWPWGSSKMANSGSIAAFNGGSERTGPAACSGLQAQHESGSGGLCRRSAADKELRRKTAAETAMARMKNMEAQSLSGLDAFSLGSCMPSKPAKPGSGSLARSSMY